jgi:hypothetical protein
MDLQFLRKLSNLRVNHRILIFDCESDGGEFFRVGREIGFACDTGRTTQAILVVCGGEVVPG